VTGRPDAEHISTSFVERQNWTVRTTMRRTRHLDEVREFFAAPAENIHVHGEAVGDRTLSAS